MYRVVRSLVLTLALLSAATGARAQTASLRGRVVDATDLRGVPGVIVTVLPGPTRTLTDGDGRFVLDGLAPGVVTVETEVLGYAPALQAEVVMQPSRSTWVEFRLEPRAVAIEGLVVRAPAFPVLDAAPTSVQVLANEELRRTPGGLLDISRTLLSLPGVAGAVDNRNDLLVRGGGPGENAYYLDGIRIPQINHFATQGASGGALGLVNVDFIQRADFFTGAFPVMYGDALSSVLSIENRPGSSEGVRGDVTLGATEAGVTLDGPAGGRANWLFSVRRSYLQLLFQALGLPIRPDYWDAQLRFEAEPTDKDRLLFVGLGAIDDFDIVAPTLDDAYESREIAAQVIDNDQRALTLGASWRRLVTGGFVTTSASRSTSEFSFRDVGSDDQAVLSNESTEGTTRIGVQADLSPRPSLRIGIGAEADRATLAANVFQRALPGGSFAADLAWNERLEVWKLGSWGQVTADLGPRLTVTAGVRADEVTGLEEGLSVSPRLSASFALGGGVTARAAGGVFHQAPSLLWLSVRENGVPVNLSLRQLRNRQFAGGLDWLVNSGLRLSAEGYLKEYDRVPLLRGDPRIAVSNLGGDYGFVGAEPLTDGGTGRARGVELFAQQKMLDRVYVLGAYTLSWSEFAGSDGVLRPSSWDRRHALDVTGGYRLGGAWELGAKLRVLSGAAYTPLDLAASAEAYRLTGRGVPDWSRLGAGRAPTSVGVDLRGERRFTFTRWNAVAYVDFQNVLGRGNVIGYTYTEDPAFPDRLRPNEGVGFLPTFGFSIEF